MGDKNKRPKRIFINDVDKYSSKYIAKFLSVCTESSEDAETEEMSASPAGPPCFHIVATVSPSSKDHTAKFLLEQYRSPSRDKLLERLLECDVVVYNISENSTQQQVEEATWALTELQAQMENFKSRKMFILVSTVMTWAMTKPQNPDEPDVVLTEEEFRRRRPHPNFKNHNNLEKLVLKLGRGKKSKLIGFVVGAGLQYGTGENLFHFFFKVSWLMQCPKVPLFGHGTNFIPMIHVHDLAGVIQNIVQLKPKAKYILAVSDGKNTLEEIVKTISDALGPGKIHKLPEQDAITMKAFKPEELEYLSINLRMDPFIIKDSFNIRWTSEAGIIENMESVVEEYKNTRQLLPIRICLVGPPAVGKTTIAEKLCRHYRIHYINIQEVIEEKTTQLNIIVNGADPEHVGEDAMAAAQRQLENINRSMEMNEGRLADHIIFDILQEKLSSKLCRNHGFVLDGFPKTFEEAKLIFSDEDMENQESTSKEPVYNKKITPEHVFSLNASDDFLTKRVQGLPENVAVKMCYTEDKFMSRLTKYKQLSNAEETLLDYFDELEIHPEHIEVDTDDPEYADVMNKVIEMVGVPKNYGLSPEEQEEEDRREEEERMLKAAAETAQKKRKNEATLAEMAAQYEEWQKNLSEVKKQECEMLETRCLPLRNYLMKYVMPSLTEAMLECCKIKPDDPVDFLAEHLLQNNQQD